MKIYTHFDKYTHTYYIPILKIVGATVKKDQLIYLFIRSSSYRDLSLNLRLRKVRGIYFHDAAQAKSLCGRWILHFHI